MAAASWRRHFSVDEGLDKYPRLHIKRPHFDDPKNRPGYHSNLNLHEHRKHKSRGGNKPEGRSSIFHINRPRDVSEEIRLPKRLRALNDESPDLSISRYHRGEENVSEENSKKGSKIADGWRSKYDSNQSDSYNSPKFRNNSNVKAQTRHDDSWGFMDSDEYSGIAPSVNTNASYTDFDGATSSTSGSLFVPRNNNLRASPNRLTSSTLDSRPHRKGKRHPGDSPDGTRTSGYCSNNTYSEMSDFTNYHKSNDPRQFKTLPAPKKQNGGGDSDTLSRKAKDDHYPRRSSNTLEDRSPRHGLYSRSHSANDSDMSVSSKDRSSKSTEKEKRGSSNSLDSKRHETDSKTQKVPSIGNVSVTVTNNIQYDPNDPFSFIQPVELPFYKKVRKCMGPIVAIVLLLILAAALGAAIYFASELKDTQEKQIDLLRANLAMRIRNTDVIPNMDSLTSQDMVNISRTYCKQMDIFYAKSEFRETYRGCEVISFQNNYLNFTLFFVEKEATSSQIIGVIESSAKKVQNASQTFAVVDKFELELDNVRITMERRMEPETFNKKVLPDPVPVKTTVPPRQNDKKTSKATPAPTTKAPIKPTPKDRPVYSWTPCEDGYEGMYFPHPTDCDKFFHCSNKISILKNCTTGHLYYWQEFTCVSKFTPNIECPDPSKAPPKPQVVTSMTSPETTPDPFFDDFYTDDMTSEGTTRPSVAPNNQSRSALAGRYPGRPSYSRYPCQSGTDGRLYPHPDDCAQFIQCVNGKEMIMNCSEGLVFDPTDKTCIFPPNPELVCPDIQPCKDKETGYFSHPFDCTKFIQCQSRTEKVLSCSDGLVWSPSVNSCIHDPNSPLCQTSKRR